MLLFIYNCNGYKDFSNTFAGDAAASNSVVKSCSCVDVFLMNAQKLSGEDLYCNLTTVREHFYRYFSILSKQDDIQSI